tara:strand:- start:33 stop:326 length:294 start_codon:yes stop_codon:yes gene_type:complete
MENKKAVHINIDANTENGKFKPETDFKEINICLGDAPRGGYSLIGWLKVQINNFGGDNRFVDLEISDEGTKTLTVDEIDIDVFIKLRDFLNYALPEE